MGVTLVRHNDRRYSPGSIGEVEFLATTEVGGGASGLTEVINGVVTRVVTKPLTPTPTDNWDMTLLDKDGVDILKGGGANRDTVNPEDVFAACPVSGTIEPVLTNCGKNKNITIRVYYE